jgi:hypothetical protein
MFEGTLEFKQTIITCYERQKIVTLQLGELQRLKCRILQSNHVMLEPYGQKLFYEPIPHSLAIL